MLRIRHTIIRDAPIKIRIFKSEILSAICRLDIAFDSYPRNDVGGKDVDEGGVIGATCDGK